MGTAREMLKKTNKQNPRNKIIKNPRSFTRLGQVSAPNRAGACSYPTISPSLFLIKSFGHELGTGIVNKQVIEEEKGREAGLGEEGPDSHPPQAGVNGLTVLGGEGTLSSRARWSHTAYGKYLHAFATLGPGARGAGRYLGVKEHPEPSDGSSDSWGPVWASLQICTVCGLLFTGRRPWAGKSKVVAGGRSPGEPRRPLLPWEAKTGLLPGPQSPQALKAPAAGPPRSSATGSQ